MKKQICILISILLTTQSITANADLLGEQLQVLKNMGVDMPDLENTMQKMRKDFAEDTESKPGEAVNPNYFSSVDQESLAQCNTGEVQLDTVCQASMIRYQAYLTAVAQNAPKQDIEAYYNQHVMAAKHYIEVHNAIVK